MGCPRFDPWPLTGRDAEVTRIEDDAERGFVLVGEAGVGKTRLLDEMSARAEQAARRVVRVVGTRSLTAVPFGAFAGVLGRTRTSEIFLRVGVIRLPHGRERVAAAREMATVARKYCNRREAAAFPQRGSPSRRTDRTSGTKHVAERLALGEPAVTVAEEVVRREDRGCRRTASLVQLCE